jgi:glycerol-3-phosphate dehydrogenase
MIFGGRILVSSLIAGAGGYYTLQRSKFGLLLADRKDDDDTVLSNTIPTRTQQLSRIRGSSRESPFDLLIIGGGATGAGCAVDSATR